MLSKKPAVFQELLATHALSPQSNPVSAITPLDRGSERLGTPDTPEGGCMRWPSTWGNHPRSQPQADRPGAEEPSLLQRWGDKTDQAVGSG